MSSPTSPESLPFELTEHTAPGYLRSRGIDFPELHCRELGGGVSNNVILVEGGGSRFILKQALPQLRVKDEWLADRSRIFREREALVDAARLLPKDWVPEVLWSDEANYLFAMRAAEQPHEFWKQRLLAGDIDTHWGRRAGIALGLTIRETWQSDHFRQKYGDQTAFDQLRIDPYYHTIAKRNHDVADAVREWVAETGSRRVALTHGDWSPKNMILTPRGMVFIDYECVHFGDPTFDSAFCINHFLLKAFHRPQLAGQYLELARVSFTWTQSVLPPEALRFFESSTSRHLGFLLLARVDGKSPVEYITNEDIQRRIRQAAKAIITRRAERLEECLLLAFEEVRRMRKSPPVQY